MQVLLHRITKVTFKMKNLNTAWTLDDRLEKDTILIYSGSQCQIRLMNDKRWPWIIVVPTGHDLVDIDDYQKSDLNPIMMVLHDISGTLKAMNLCQSTNVGTLGNVVKQMHWHVVGRSEDDPNWPAPVWGFEKPVPYGKDEADQFIHFFKKAYRGSFF
jgi:diadenosine tetraphosphate (Ap4A) HIT family hydrolase